MIMTADDDLFVKRAANNQVKTVAPSKADRERQIADAIADALLVILLLYDLEEEEKSRLNLLKSYRVNSRKVGENNLRYGLS